MTRRILTATASLLGMAAILAGLPALLLLTFGPPLPSKPPSWEEISRWLIRPDDGSALLAYLQIIGWGGWAMLGWSTIAEIWEWITNRRLYRLPSAGLIPRLIAGISSSPPPARSFRPPARPRPTPTPCPNQTTQRNPPRDSPPGKH